MHGREGDLPPFKEVRGKMGRPRIVVTSEQLAEIIAAIRAGKTPTEIAREIGLKSPSAIYRIALENGLEAKRKEVRSKRMARPRLFVTSEQLAEIIAAIRAGKTPTEIAREIGLKSRSPLYRIALENNLEFANEEEAPECEDVTEQLVEAVKRAEPWIIKCARARKMKAKDYLVERFEADAAAVEAEKFKSEWAKARELNAKEEPQKPFTRKPFKDDPAAIQKVLYRLQQHESPEKIAISFGVAGSTIRRIREANRDAAQHTPQSSANRVRTRRQRIPWADLTDLPKGGSS
jgi:transposase-like protein